MRTIFIIFLIIVIAGCKQSANKVIDTYPGGQTMTEYIYPDKRDTSNYICKVYYASGVLKHESQVSDNLFIGEKKSFYENGSIERIEKLYQPTALTDEIYDCHVTNYHRDGAKESEYQYRNDKLNGLAIDYDSAGRKVRTAEYVDDKMNGKEILYYPNGKIKSMVTCRNDSAYGYEFRFTESGDTLTASIHFGQSDNGVFYKKWLSDGRILTGSYGDPDRSFVVWKWYDKKRAFIKSVNAEGVFLDSLRKSFIAPE